MMTFRLAVFAVACAFLGLVGNANAQTAVAPSIASISQSQTVVEGVSLTLTVSVNGTSPFTYQWKKEGTAISGATNGALVLSQVRVANAGTYTVVVANAGGTVTSGPVVLAVTPATAPSFSWSGGPLSYTVGTTMSISPYVSGSSPFTYQWSKDGSPIAGATNGTYSKPNVQTTDAGSYTLAATNIAGSATCTAYTVTIAAAQAPTIGTLNNATVSLGDYFSFWPSVNGTDPITYQWYKDGVAISGAQSYYYSKSSAQASDAGVYTLKATNSVGSVTSNGATLTIRAAVAPTVSSMSSPISVAVGGSFSVYANVSGTSPFTYQWCKDGQVISGATSSGYSRSNAQLSDAGAYSVIVTNSVGSVTSSAVTVTVTNATAPIITYMPGSRTVRIGDWLGYVDVNASGTAPLSFQWKKDGVAIAGATSSSLNVHYYADATDAGSYTVVVSNAQGSVTSQPFVLTILPAVAPTITSQPVTQSVKQGQSLYLTVNASGTSPLTFQWKKDGVAITGQTWSSFQKSAIASSDGGTYSVVVSNTVGSATSTGAVVTILPNTIPKITSHPASASLLPGDSFWGLYVGTLGSNVSVQWYLNGVAIQGATSEYYSIYNAQPSNAGSYYAIVSNSAGSATSQTADITIDSNATRPVITYVSGSQAIRGGSSATISIATSSSGESVQWYKDGVLIPNGSGKSYSFNSFGVNAGGSYTAKVTNANTTVTSKAISLELLDAGTVPVITRQPSPIVVTPNSYYPNFSVETEGEFPQTFQWKKDGTAITGATSSSYSLYSPKSTDVGSYTVVVTNRNGTVTSSAATLSLAPTAAVTAPIITYGPASQTVTIGSSINLGASVYDTTGVKYQSYKDGVAVANGTSSSLYYYTTAALGYAGQYYVVVSNSAGSATSNTAVVVVTSSMTGPSFTTQPASQDKYYGNTVVFTAAASGTGTISYQWRKNGSPIASATSTTLTLTNVQNADAGTYTLVATDSVGSTSSLPAVLTLTGGTAPALVSVPSPTTVLQGGSVTFTASASGTPTPTFQWWKNGVAITGATGGTLTLSNVQSGDEGTYRFVATNALGSVAADAKLTVIYPPPAITKQPVSTSVQPGGAATFSVEVTAFPTPSYQWRKNGTVIAGATNSALVILNAQSTDGGRYSVVVTTAFGSATSAEALLTVGNPITVTAPQNQTVYVGGTATFTCTVNATDTLVYSWARNGVVIPNATGTSLTITNAQLSDAGAYTFGITRSDGSVVYPLSGNGAIYATLTVLPRKGPLITRQPASVTAKVGEAVTLSVAAEDSGPITYQWQKVGSAPVPNEFTSVLVLRNVQFADAGDYHVTAIGVNGSTVSANATVTVTGSAVAGVYFGSTGAGDPWALHVSGDGTGTFLSLLGGRNQAVVARGFKVSDAGDFTFGTDRVTAAAGASTLADRYFTGQVSGTIRGGAVNGVFSALGVQFSGLAKTGGTNAPGTYQAVPMGTDLGEVALISAGDGTALLVSVDSSGVKGGRGTVGGDGLFSIPAAQYKFVGMVSAGDGTVKGSYEPVNGVSIPFATAATASSPERLVNVATRGFSSGGSRMLTAGFVISGNASKDVLIRAVGPGLSGFGLSGLLANPAIRLFKDGVPVMFNDDWTVDGFGTEITETAKRVGAFPLPAGSVDAALIARLTPGAYTAQVNAPADASGVVLVEVYDASTSGAEPQKLINLSTRGFVDQGSNVMIAGIVVNGSAPRKLLIRGIGPGLTKYGVTDALSDPKVELYRGTTVLRQNDNWSESADNAAISAAAVSVGAFALPDGSKDAAILVYLAPGNYTAVVSGTGASTGVALVEVYEVP